MTKEILKSVNGAMSEQDVTQAELATLAEVTPTQAGRILRGESNQLPKFWETAFKRLGLRLVAVPEDAEVFIQRKI